MEKMKGEATSVVLAIIGLLLTATVACATGASEPTATTTPIGTAPAGGHPGTLEVRVTDARDALPFGAFLITSVRFEQEGKRCS